ncbi:MAG: tyrosine-type recombinase/integrase [Halioglobus sp.]|nr:tyrosine-type recombinase/integrase [Halioglobus sp.]
MIKLSDATDLGYLLQNFFCSYLINQRRVSANTVASYRDTFRLLLRFLENKQHVKASTLTLDDINHNNILCFLQDLEVTRHNGIRTRNARLAAIRSFLNFAATETPEMLPNIQKSLSIPSKRADKIIVQCLSKIEINALVSAPDTGTWSGLRDHMLLMTLYNTGARVTELIQVQRQDIDLQHQHAIHLHGKGRKERVIPLWSKTVSALRQWSEHYSQATDAAVFPNRFGQGITRSGVQQRLHHAQALAVSSCPSLKKRKISPHTIRHTTALHLLQSGVDLSVIALWLGHEQIDTTHQYMDADLAMKKAALASLTPLDGELSNGYKGLSDNILDFLESL